MNTPPPAEVRSQSKRRIWLFRLIAIGFPLLLLVLVEVGLRVAGTGYPTEFLVPHPTKPGYLVDNYKFAWRFFPKALARAPRPIVVKKQKPANTFRICVFGGSAAMGDPEPAYGMPRVIETLLRERFPAKEFEVVNCAVTAINSHVVRDIARDCRKLDADAWVIYLGNNEVHGPFGAGTVFGRSDRSLWMNRLGLGFKRMKLGQLLSGGGTASSKGAPKKWGGMQMFLDQKVPLGDSRLRKVYADFETNLNAIVDAARSNTKIVIGTVASNLKDFPPFVSADLDSDEFNAACRLQADGKYEEALAALEKVEDVGASTSAEFWYRKGQCILSSVEPSQIAASDAFESARDLDMLRFRADSEINSVIENVAVDRSLVLIDSEEVLTKDAAILGNEHFHEHVHFNFAGNYRLGQAFARQLADSLELAADGDLQGGWLSEDECADELGLTPFHERLTLVDVQGRLNSPPFSDQLGHATRDAAIAVRMQQLASKMTPQLGQQSHQQYQRLIESRPDDWLLRQQFALLLDSIGQQAAAAEQFSAIANQLPHNAEAQFRLGAQYNRMKQREKAEVALRKAIALRPDFVRAYNSLGICLSHLDRADESYDHFAKAVAIQPTFAEAFVNWGMVLAAKGRQDDAAEKYRKAIGVAPNNLKAHAALGKHFVLVNNYQDAMPHYEAIARVLPNDVAAQLNLGMLYLKFGGHHEQARSQFERVLELSPGNLQATEALRQL